jgi:C-terminal processing protease CtpA/Prc
MRNATFLLALLAGVGVATGSVAAAPGGQQPPRSVQAGEAEASGQRGRLGFGALEISPELRAVLGAPADRGVLVDRLRPDSPAARAGVRVGDVVIQVDAAPAASVGDIVDAIADRRSGDAVALEVVRGRARVTVQVKLDSDPAPAPERRWERFGDEPLALPRLFGDAELRRELDATRKRVQELERRLDKLEHR